MPLLATEAAKLSNNELVAGVVEEIIQRDDLFAVLPFIGVNGKAYVYNRENSLGSADWLNPNDSVNESASTFDEIVTTLKILAGDVDIDKFLQATESDTNDQMAVQIAKKAKGVGRVFHQTLATGDTGVNAAAFDGLPVLVDSSQVLTAATNGAALSFALMDQLLDQVPLGADVIIMRRGTIRAYRGLLRATYGTDAVMQMMDNFGRPMLTHNGVPIIMNEFLSGTETCGTNSTTCSVYAVRLNELDGLHGIYGGGNAGIVVENIGTVQTKDATRIRLKWYVSVVLKSTKSLACLKGITNV